MATTAHDPSWWLGFFIGAFGASLAVGAALGVIPLVLGQSLGQRRTGRVCFFVTLAAGFIGGAFAALPTSLICCGVILVRWRRGKRSPEETTEHVA